jgi:hypothetical protein
MGLDIKRYENKIPIGNRAAYRTEAARLKDLLKQDLFTHHSVHGPMAEWAWNKAWEDGHSGGLTEVIDGFAELVEFIQLAVKLGAAWVKV